MRAPQKKFPLALLLWPGLVILALILFALLHWLPERSEAPVLGPMTRVEPAAQSLIAGKRLVHLTITPHVGAAEALARWFQEETGAIIQIKVVSYDELAAAIEADQRAGSPVLDVVLTFYTDIAAGRARRAHGFDRARQS